MRAVPASLREASYGLGARPVTTATRVVVPAAISGIVAAMILGDLARRRRDDGRRDRRRRVRRVAPHRGTRSSRAQTMTAAMAALATGSDQVAGNTAAFQSLFFVGLAPVPDHPRAQRRGRRLRPPRPPAVLRRSTMATPSVTTVAVSAGARRQAPGLSRHRVLGICWSARCSLTL